MIDAMALHVWQSTWFACAAALLTLAFRANQARVRYWIWLTASYKFLIPFALLASVGSHIQAWAHPPVGQIAVASPAFSYTLDQVSQRLFLQDTVPVLASVPGSRWNMLNAVLAGLWLCGLICVALIRVRGWRRIRLLVRASVLTNVIAPVEVCWNRELSDGYGPFCFCRRELRNAFPPPK